MLPSQLEDPRQAASLVQYQVRLLHCIPSALLLVATKVAHSITTGNPHVKKGGQYVECALLLRVCVPASIGHGESRSGLASAWRRQGTEKHIV